MLTFRIQTNVLTDGSTTFDVIGQVPDGAPVFLHCYCRDYQHAEALLCALEGCTQVETNGLYPRESYAIGTIGDICGDALDDRNTR
jgi:hypothetical protein